MFEKNADGTKTLMACYKNKIEEYVVPEGVTDICDGAFYFCGELRYLTLPSSLTRFSESILPARVREIKIPASVEHIESKFNRNKLPITYSVHEDNPYYFVENKILYHKTEEGLEVVREIGNSGEVFIKEGTVRILSTSFLGNNKVTRVVCPSTLKHIESKVFGALEEISLNEGLEVIESNVIDSSLLKSVSLPSTLRILGKNAFSSCPLVAYNVSEENKWYSSCDGILFDKEKTVLLDVPKKIELEKIELPESVVEIGTAFNNCENVKEIILSDAIKEIVSTAFICNASKIYCGEQIAYIGRYAFKDYSETRLKIYGKKNGLVEQYVQNSISKVTHANITFIQKGAEDIASLSKEFDLSLNETGLTIVKLLQESECVVIPETIGGYPVTKIADRAFTTIDFSGGMMVELVLPDTVTEIGAKLCDGRKKLQSVKLSKHIKVIPESAFLYCNDLKALDIPEGVETIEASAFFGCEKLCMMRVPASVTNISEHIFADPKKQYKDLYLPNKMICIVEANSYAEKFFQEYKPEWEKTICLMQESDSVTFEFTDNTVLGVESFINDDYTVTVQFLETWKCTEEEIRIPEKIYGLPVTKVTGFGKMGYNVKLVELPKTVETLEGFARTTFTYNQVMETIIIDKDNPNFYSDGQVIYTKDKSVLLHMCSFVAKEYTVQKETKVIGEKAFVDCRLLQKVVLPEGIEEIRSNAFWNCVSLEEIVGIENATNVDATAIVNTPFYKKQDVVMNGTVLQKYSEVDKKKYVMKDGVTEIADYAFKITNQEDKDQLEELVISDTVTKIGKNAFEGRSKLRAIQLPQHLTEVSEGLFSQCTSLQEVVISEEVTTIKTNAFSKCSSLKQLVIPKSVTKIEPLAMPIEVGAANRWSKSCPSVFEELVVDEANEVYCSKDGVLYSKDMTILYLIPTNIQMSTFVVPDTVTTIAEYAGFSNKQIKKIVLPKSVTTIEREAFNGCASLENINLECVKTIGKHAFYACKNMQKVDLQSLERVEDAVFTGCTNLSQVTLPNVKTVGKSAFAGCTALSHIELPDGLEVIEECAFARCNLSKVTVPKTVQTTGNEAFSGCEEITIYDTIDPTAKPCDAKIDETNGHPNSIVGFIGIGQAWAMWQCAANHKWIDHEIIVRSAQTNEIKYKVPMKSDPTQRQFYCILTSAWGHNATFCFQTVDDFFPRIKGASYKLEVALNRLRYKVDLTEEAQKGYEAYLVRNAKEVMRQCITNGDMETLQFCEPFGIIKKNNIDEMIEFANKEKAVSFVAYFMEYKNTHFGGTKKVGSGLSLSEKAPKTQKDKEWSITKNAPGKVARYKGIETELVFPTEVGGVKATGVANTTTKVPENYKNIVSVVLPEGYRTIGDCAFYGCENLEKVVLPSTLETIGRSAFESCKKLKEVVIPDNVTLIGRSAFENCTSLKDVTFGNSVSIIEERAFINCYPMTKVDLPKSLRSLAKDCFRGSNIDIVIIRSDSVGSSGQCFDWPKTIYAKKEAVATVYGLHPTKVRPLSELEVTALSNIQYADPSEQRLAGKTFVITGSFHTFPDRDELKKFIESHGGRMTGSVSKKTSYLLTNEENATTVKAQKAVEIGVPIMTEKEFLELVKK